MTFKQNKRIRRKRKTKESLETVASKFDLGSEDDSEDEDQEGEIFRRYYKDWIVWKYMEDFPEVIKRIKNILEANPGSEINWKQQEET